MSTATMTVPTADTSDQYKLNKTETWGKPLLWLHLIEKQTEKQGYWWFVLNPGDLYKEGRG